jgi:phenylalanyl-tRNA synthetase beta chain
MKVSLNWLKKYVDVTMDIDDLVDKIGSQLGAVEEVVDLGEKYAGVVIVKVVSCKPHNNADKLKVCLIDDNKKVQNVERTKEGYVEVVCGAPNVQAGMMVAWLPPGSIVPESFEGNRFTLEAREIRGVKSNGMLASASELALSDDHSGLLVIDDGKPGDSFAKTYELDDYVIDIENKMFTHRPDCFGIIGIAREIAGITGKNFKSPDWYMNAPKDAFEPDDQAKLKLSIDNQIPESVPRFMAVAIANVKVGASPLIIQTYLQRSGIRPINNIVDITNYIMLLTAQPLHAYDYDKVAQLGGDKDHARIVVRKSKKGEKIHLLNGKEADLSENTITIASGTKPIGVGGVMGGSTTEVDNETRNIILECATFNMYTIRRTSMAMGLFTDAVTRFNKGQSPHQNDKILAEAVAKIKHLASGKVASTVEDSVATIVKPKDLLIEQDFVNNLLGLSLSTNNIGKLLKNVEFEVEPKGTNSLNIGTPFWRTDIEIPEDVVEEVGRLHGYDNLPLKLPVHSIAPIEKNEDLEVNAKIRRVLAMSGANEVLTYSFVHGNTIKNAGQNVEKALQLSNALSPDLQYYRLSLTPSLLDKIQSNLRTDLVRGEDNEFALFEINKVHNNSDKDAEGLPRENYDLALVFAADAKTSKRKYEGSPYYQAKKYLNSLASNMALAGIQLGYLPFNKNDLKGSTWLEELSQIYEPNRSAILKGSNGQIYGLVGEFRSSVKKAFKLPEFCAGFEIDSRLFKENQRRAPYVVLPKYPKVQQDISLKVPRDLTYAKVFDFVWDELTKKLPPNTLPTLGPVDIYHKDGDSKNQHITLRLWISAYDRTLKSEEVNALLDEIAKSANEKLGIVRI